MSYSWFGAPTPFNGTTPNGGDSGESSSDLDDVHSTNACDTDKLPHQQPPKTSTNGTNQATRLLF